MKKHYLYFALLAGILFSACTSSYKSTQMVDDVYYSPARNINTYDTRQDDVVRYADPDERIIRMRTYDPRWRYLDYDYNYYGYNYGYNYYGHNYSPYYYGYNTGYYYNPFYYPVPVYTYNPYAYITPRNTAIRKSNLAVYTQPRSTFSDPKTKSPAVISSRDLYNNSNSSYNRRVILPESRKSRNTYSSPDNSTRSYEPRSSTPSSSSGNSSGSSSGSVNRPGRGN
ncbi:MAG: hypothetical protein J0H76_11315 [Sphingobacteriales bacterium]|nr:hypothetical protein [Sphingobacteriales bacterium]